MIRWVDCVLEYSPSSLWESGVINLCPVYLLFDSIEEGDGDDDDEDVFDFATNIAANDSNFLIEDDEVGSTECRCLYNVFALEKCTSKFKVLSRSLASESPVNNYKITKKIR